MFRDTVVRKLVRHNGIRTEETTAMFEERIEAIYDAHSAALMHALLGWTSGDWQASEDLLQETMVRAWRNIEVLNPDPAVLRPWLMTVARRVTIDRFRARVARPLETDVAEIEWLCERADPYEHLLDRHMLRAVLGGLSDPHRQALVQVYLLDRTVPEAAAALGVPEGTVKSRLHHALRSVRRVFEEPANRAEAARLAFAAG